MPQLNSHRLQHGITIPLVALAGCATPTLVGHAQFDYWSTPAVFIGYFSSAQHLDAQPCSYHEEIDCFGLTPSAKAVVKEALFGSLPRAKLDLLGAYTEHPERFPLGPGALQLIYVEPGVLDEERALMSLRGYSPLSRLKSGGLAIPVATDDDLPDLPCAGEDRLKVVPLQFAAPQPSRPIDEYSSDELVALRSNPRVSIRGDNVYFNHGVTLDAVREIREVMAKDQYFSACWKSPAAEQL